MNKYKLVITDQMTQDTNDFITYKLQKGTYPEHINKFRKQLLDYLSSLLIFPNSGTKLDTRVNINTNVRFHSIEDCVVFYEVINMNIVVLRLIPSNANWMKIIIN